MWTTLALTLLLQPAPAQGSLTIANDRLTYGYNGPDRKDAEYLPGDAMALAFEVRNMTFDESGKASYSVSMEILDGKGDVRFRQLPRNQTAQNYLGGKSMY